MYKRYNASIEKTFVEFGCRDGIEHSNTWALETQLGWKGLCIEAIEQVNPVRKRGYQGAVCAPEMEGKNITFDVSAAPRRPLLLLARGRLLPPSPQSPRVPGCLQLP